MPRRALLFITSLVLALHWLVLQGVPLDWNGSPGQPAARVFSTRSIAALPPTAPPLPPVDANPTAPATKPRSRPAPQRQPMPPAPPAETLVLPEATEVAAIAPPERPPAHHELPEAPAPAPSAPASQPALEPAAPQPSAGVDIIAPSGSAASHASTTTPLPVRIPPSMRLAFDVSGQAKKFTYSASAELLWQHDGSRYEARQEISAFLVGSRAQRSVGAITQQGLQPERFSDKSRSEQAAHFDHAQGRVTFSANTPDAAVGPGAQDRLSVFIQLSALLAADPGRFAPGTQVTLPTVSARSADRWSFSIEGPETLELPSGPIATLKLQRLPRKDYDQKAELWLAPGLSYLPVRIRITQSNGDFADLRLRRNETLP